MPWIAAGDVARDLYFFPVNSLLFKKRPGWIAALTILAAAVTNCLLVPRFGIMAAAVNTFIAFTLLFGFVYFAGQRAFAVRYEWGRLLRLFALALALFAVGWWFVPSENLLVTSCSSWPCWPVCQPCCG